MANVNQRSWRVPGQRSKRKAWGFTAQIVENGQWKQRRCYRAEWTRDDAEKALAALLLRAERPKTEASPAGLTLVEAAARYLAAKARKRSLKTDETILEHLKSVFGADTPLIDLTASRISEYKAERLAAKSERRTGASGEATLLSAASINRPLALLRHLLRLAHEEWQVLGSVPRIRLETEPQGRIRWLEPEEEARLLTACAKSRNPSLVKIVSLALETGLRKGELLGLTWDRVDLSRGVLRLELTKSGRRREVPMRQVVYETLASLEGSREGRLWRSADIRTTFENAVAEAKSDDFHFHDCRHHFASWFVMRGGSLQALKEILGHVCRSSARSRPVRRCAVYEKSTRASARGAELGFPFIGAKSAQACGGVKGRRRLTSGASVPLAPPAGAAAVESYETITEAARSADRRRPTNVDSARSSEPDEGGVDAAWRPSYNRPLGFNRPLGLVDEGPAMAPAGRGHRDGPCQDTGRGSA